MATGVSATKWNCERQPIARTAAGADVSVALSYAGKKSVDEINKIMKEHDMQFAMEETI